MALSIRQQATNYTVYPEVPLQAVFPAPVLANSLLVVFVFGNRTSFDFNQDAEIFLSSPPTVDDINGSTLTSIDPTIASNKGDVFTVRAKFVNIFTELSSSPPVLQSPPVVSPDASGYYPSLFAYTATATAGDQTITVIDSGLSLSSPPNFFSPPTVGRPAFDGGLRVSAFEIIGKYNGTGQTAFDKAFQAIGMGPVVVGNGIITPTNANELVMEAIVMIDSSAIGLGTGATFQQSHSLPAGSSHLMIQSTLQGGSAVPNAGFGDPISYAAAVVALALE